jgi:hypothetical protein
MTQEDGKSSTRCGQGAEKPALRRRDDLARIEDILRIERPLQRVQCFGTELRRRRSEIPNDFSLEQMAAKDRQNNYSAKPGVDGGPLGN